MPISKFWVKPWCFIIQTSSIWHTWAFWIIINSSETQFIRITLANSSKSCLESQHEHSEFLNIAHLFWASNSLYMTSGRCWNTWSVAVTRIQPDWISHFPLLKHFRISWCKRIEVEVCERKASKSSYKAVRIHIWACKLFNPGFSFTPFYIFFQKLKITFHVQKPCFAHTILIVMKLLTEAPNIWALFDVLCDLISVFRIRVLDEIHEIICFHLISMNVTYIFGFSIKFGVTLMFNSWVDTESVRN